MADEFDPPRKFYRLKEKEFERVNDPSSRGTVDPNDVRSLLQSNLAAEKRQSENASPPPPRRPSRRTRDYMIAMVVGNLVLVAATFVSPIFGVAGLIIFNLGITWIMWFAMSDD